MAISDPRRELRTGRHHVPATAALGLCSLTAFEKRILSLRASGLDRHEIARALNRSPQTISNALTVAKEKLCARTLVEAAVLLAAARDA